MKNLDEHALALVARYFAALSVPARLRILNHLRDGERNVGEITAATGGTQANVSKHLQILHTHGLVSRRKDGQFVHYGLADRRVFELCALVCDSLDDAVASRRQLLAL